MIVKVLCFGHYADHWPGEQPLEVAAGSTVADLAAQVAARDPRLKGIRDICRAAVNEEYAPSGQVLRDGDVVAFIPPMSGG